MDDVSRIAVGLSPAQRDALRAFCSRKNSPWGYYATDLGVTGAACSALERKGLLDGGLFPGDRMKSYRWTNRGNDVFHALPRDSEAEASPE